MTAPTAPIHTATCPYCDQVMAPDASCLPMLRDEEGGVFERIRYGSDGDWPRAEPRVTCWDCAVLTGKVHHLHCDQERCPKCGGQLLREWEHEACDLRYILDLPDEASTP